MVSPAALSITTTSFVTGVVGNAYTQSLTASGGTQQYSWSVVSGQLPSWMTWSGSSQLVGAQPTAGSTTFTLQVADSGVPQQTAQQTYTVSVVSGGAGTQTTREFIRMGSQPVAVETLAPAPPPVTVQISPGAFVSLGTGDTQNFCATVNPSGSNQNVSFEAFYGSFSNYMPPPVNCSQYQAPTAGVTSAGVTDIITVASVIPGTTPVSENVSVALTSVVVCATSVFCPPPSPLISQPSSSQTQATEQLYSIVSPNLNQAVSWSLRRPSCSTGRVDLQGSLVANGTSATYTAPSNVTSTLITSACARSAANPFVQSGLGITVDPVAVPTPLSLSPKNVAGTQSQTFQIGVTSGTTNSLAYVYLLINNTPTVETDGTGCLLQLSPNGTYLAGTDNWTGTPYCSISYLNYTSTGQTTGTVTVTVNLAYPYLGSWTSLTNLNVWVDVVDSDSNYDQSYYQMMGSWTLP